MRVCRQTMQICRRKSGLGEWHPPYPPPCARPCWWEPIRWNIFMTLYDQVETLQLEVGEQRKWMARRWLNHVHLGIEWKTPVLSSACPDAALEQDFATLFVVDRSPGSSADVDQTHSVHLRPLVLLLVKFNSKMYMWFVANLWCLRQVKKLAMLVEWRI